MNDTWTVTITYRDIDGMEYTRSVSIDGRSMRQGAVGPDVQITWRAIDNYKQVVELVKATRTDAV